MNGSPPPFLFDVGIVRALSGMRLVQPGTEEFGRAFEPLSAKSATTGVLLRTEFDRSRRPLRRKH